MLIITADDLGFSPSRNEAILEAVRFGTVSCASLMVNMPFSEDACRKVRESTPQLGLGLHFTLSSGRPVAPVESVPLLINELGLFRHGFVSLWRHAGYPKFLEQVRIEFEAQCRLMDEWEKRYELKVDHLDSHQHVHAIRPIGTLLEEWAEERNLALRLPQEPYGAFERFIPILSTPIIGEVKKFILDFCTRNAFAHPEHVYFGVLNSGKVDRNAWNRILKIVARSPQRLFEVNVHPGLDVKIAEEEAESQILCAHAGDLRFHQSPGRYTELCVLLDADFRRTLGELGLLPLATWKTASL